MTAIESGDARDDERRAAFDAFLREFWSDLDQGRARPIGEYLARYPSIADQIAAEYAALREGIVDADSDDVGASLSKASEAERKIGRYEILRVLGRGGMGKIHLAWDPELRRKVVLKTLSGVLGRDAKALERMRREARVAGRIAHEGICPVLDVLTEEDGVVIVLPLIEGETVAARLARARLRAGDARAHSPVSLSDRAADSDLGFTSRPGDEGHGDLRHLLRFMEQVAEAVHAMHEAGVVHRDLKPGNIMIRPDGQPVVLDFGLAVDETSERLTTTGDVLGTPLYMAPEQVEGHLDRIDPRTDVHALGAILYELLTLKSPFEAPTMQAVLKRICSGDVPPLRKLNPRVPLDLEAVCLKALAFERKQRYASAADLAADLRNVRTLQPTVARPPSLAGRLLRRVRRAPSTWSFAFFAVLVIVAGTVVFRWQRQELDARAAAVSDGLVLAEVMQRFWRGEAQIADLQPVLEKYLDPRTREQFMDDPRNPAAMKSLVSAIQDEARSGGESILLKLPFRTVANARPAFVFWTGRPTRPPAALELWVVDDSGAIVPGFPLAILAAEPGRMRFELPPSIELQTERSYRWTVTREADTGISPGNEPSTWAEFRIVAAERLSGLLAIRSTGNDDVDRVLGAAVLLENDMAQGAVELIERDGADTNLAVEAWRLYFLAKAASLLGDKELLFRAEDALETVRKALAAERGTESRPAPQGYSGSGN